MTVHRWPEGLDPASKPDIVRAHQERMPIPQIALCYNTSSAKIRQALGLRNAPFSRKSVRDLTGNRRLHYNADGEPVLGCARLSAPLGNRLQQLRKEKGLYLREVAAAVGSSTTHICNLETRGCVPSTKLLHRLAEFYAVPEEELDALAKERTAKIDEEEDMPVVMPETVPVRETTAQVLSVRIEPRDIALVPMVFLALARDDGLTDQEAARLLELWEQGWRPRTIAGWRGLVFALRDSDLGMGA